MIFYINLSGENESSEYEYELHAKFEAGDRGDHWQPPTSDEYKLYRIIRNGTDITHRVAKFPKLWDKFQTDLDIHTENQ